MRVCSCDGVDFHLILVLEQHVLAAVSKRVMTSAFSTCVSGARRIVVLFTCTSPTTLRLMQTVVGCRAHRHAALPEKSQRPFFKKKKPVLLPFPTQTIIHQCLRIPPRVLNTSSRTIFVTKQDRKLLFLFGLRKISYSTPNQTDAVRRSEARLGVSQTARGSRGGDEMNQSPQRSLDRPAISWQVVLSRGLGYDGSGNARERCCRMRRGQ